MDYQIHGHAIISDDHRIADASGQTPAALRHDADWSYFQSQLDRVAVTVLGRLGHEANPNINNRNRLIVTASLVDIDRRTDGLWWNPAGASLQTALRFAAPGGGIVAVPGGQGIFDLFLTLGYDEFHLNRANGVEIGAGKRIFSACEAGRTPEMVLADHGLTAAGTHLLDPANNVTQTIWKRL